MRKENVFAGDPGERGCLDDGIAGRTGMRPRLIVGNAGEDVRAGRFRVNQQSGKETRDQREHSQRGAILSFLHAGVTTEMRGPFLPCRMATAVSQERTGSSPYHLFRMVKTVLGGWIICLMAACTLGSEPPSEGKPNVLVILADDLGFSDLGCYGGEIETPNLDALAKEGLRFTQFYNTARCWPTRASILTGYYAQQVRRDKIEGIRSGAEGSRPSWARLLPEMLRPLGYSSYHSGKWHLDGMPLQNGFDRSYYLRDQWRYFNPRVHYEDDRKLPAVRAGTGFYGTTAIADHAIRCLKEHAEKHAEKPFFHYLAFTAPHFPLHALPEDIARYRERYREGWEKVRAERWKRLRGFGIVDGTLSRPERDVGPPYHFPKALEVLGPGEVNRPLPWGGLTDRQREFQAAKMAIHAAMIDRMDREIGRVLGQLRAMGGMENTLIFFLSDNGASAEIMVRADGHDPSAAPGSAATYLCLGPGWSTTSNTPFRRHKTWVHEGGIATPFIVHWPKGIPSGGELRHMPGHVVDLAPTILEVAGGTALETWKGKPMPPAPGKSLAGLFRKPGRVERDCLWWSHEGNRAIRIGDWKLVAAGKEGPWELYDLGADRSETNDLAGMHLDRVRQMADAWTRRRDAFREDALREPPPDPKRRPASSAAETGAADWGPGV